MGTWGNRFTAASTPALTRHAWRALLFAVALLFTSVTACAGGGGGDGASDSQAVTVVSDGNSSFRIVVDENAHTMVRHAAGELAAHIEAATGTHLPVRTDTGADIPRISVSVDPALGIGAEGYRISAVGGNVRIVGNDATGARYGVYEFLERYAGVRWFAPNYTHVPERERIVVPRETVTERPAFTYREAFVREADDPLYSAHNRLNGRFGQRLTGYTGSPAFTALRKRNIFRLVPPGRHREEHPEYFGGGQLRFAEPGVRRVAIDAVRELLAEWGNGDYALLIEHADVDSYYDEAPDAALIERYGTPAGAYLDFVRAIARAVADDYPDVTILAQAYRWSRQPPRAMRLPSNMAVMFSDIERDFARPLSAEVNRPILEDLEGWQRVAGRVLVWTYMTNFAGYLQPFPDFEALPQDLRRLNGLSAVRGVFAQGAYNTLGSEFAPLRAWLLGQLLWEPGQDPQTLIDEFLAGYYGDAAPQVGAYIDLLQETVAATGTPVRDKMGPAAAYLTTDMLQRADRLFERAMERVADQPAYRQHVQTARMPVDYAILSNPDFADSPGRQARLERFAAAMEAADMSAYREGRGNPPSQLVEALSIARTPAPLPQRCREADEPACPVAQELSFDLAGGARIVAETGASNGAAARLSGDRSAWGIQLPLERLLPREGEWRIYARVRVPGSDGGYVDHGLNAGIYPGERGAYSQGELGDEAYTVIRLPGTWRRGGDRYVWFASPRTGQVDAVIVDRLFAVREEDGA